MNVSRLVLISNVEPMQNVKPKTITHSVSAYPITKATHIHTVIHMTVLKIPTVQPLSPVETTNVWILVHVLQMQNVMPETTEDIAHVNQDTEEILMMLDVL